MRSNRWLRRTVFSRVVLVAPVPADDPANDWLNIPQEELTPPDTGGWR